MSLNELIKTASSRAISGAKYAGEVSPTEAWEALSENKDAILVDVRTEPEWQFVGVPNLTPINKDTLLISWRIYPEMDFNQPFLSTLSNQVTNKNTPIFFLCRTGVRSLEAAVAATEAGFTTCFNITNGFEGSTDDKGHRSQLNGWKSEGLAWQQA